MRTKTSAQAEKILRVAARLFATQRFHEARMDDIAAAAEVGKGTLYRYFHDKDELYQALLEQAGAQLLQSLQEARQGVCKPRARLEAIVAAIVTYFDEHPHLFDLIQHAEVMHRSEQPFAWLPTRHATFGLVEDTLREGQECGAWPELDVHLATLVLLGGLRTVLRYDSGPHGPELPRKIVDLILHGACQGRPCPDVQPDEGTAHS